SGHATVPPPSVMNSRRLMCSPSARGSHSTTSECRVVHHSQIGRRSSNLVGCSTGNRYSFMVQIIVAWFSFFLTRRSCVVTQRLLPKVHLRSTQMALPASLS